MEKKNELVDETVDICDVKKDDLGGFIENEDNLSHYGDVYISFDAYYPDNAYVSYDGTICNTAKLYGNARVCDRRMVL